MYSAMIENLCDATACVMFYYGVIRPSEHSTKTQSHHHTRPGPGPPSNQSIDESNTQTRFAKRKHKHTHTNTQIITRDVANGVLWAGSDGRGDGCAMGW